MDIKKELVEKLEKDCEVILNQKLKSALDNSNEGSYRNLVKALETNMELIEKYNSQQQDLKDITIKSLSDLKFINADGDVIYTIDFATNIEICHIATSYGDFKGTRTVGKTPVDLLGKKYKLISNGTLESTFNKKTYNFELEIGSIELMRQTRNDELVFMMFAEYGNPLYTIKVLVE